MNSMTRKVVAGTNYILIKGSPKFFDELFFMCHEYGFKTVEDVMRYMEYKKIGADELFRYLYYTLYPNCRDTFKGVVNGSNDSAKHPSFDTTKTLENEIKGSTSVVDLTRDPASSDYNIESSIGRINSAKKLLTELRRRTEDNSLTLDDFIDISKKYISLHDQADQIHAVSVIWDEFSRNVQWTKKN